MKKMKINLKRIVLVFFLCLPVVLAAQEGALITGNVYSEQEGGLVGVTVLEIDKTDRTVSATTSDFSGNFSLQIKNSNNKLSFSYVGFKTAVLQIGSQRKFSVKLDESTTLAEVVIVTQAVHNDGTFAIPKREIAGAVQRINTAELKGLSVASIDDALQGRIAGLDIVGASGNLGAGSTLRIRGTSSLNAKSEPLIVVNDVPFENNISSLDLNNATEEQFANLLNISPDDIEEITVLKDGASAAIWGARGANGVISIRTKKGVKGPTRIQYSYRFSGKQQPSGIPLLNGDEYTMMMKQAYFNPYQQENSAVLPEFSYDPNFYEYENFNNNTDWVKEITQYGFDHDHNLTVSGGGEKATFRMSLGYLSQRGTVIKQSLDRITSRMNFEYRLSDRISFTPEFAVTYVNNHQNLAYDPSDEWNTNNLQSIAYKKMPNVSVFRQDAFGNNTGQFYAIPNIRHQSAYDGIPLLDEKQRRLANPVAYAYLGTNNNKSLRVTPKLSFRFDFLDPASTMLRYNGYLSLDYNSENDNRFYPRELFPDDWTDASLPNRSYMADKAALTVNSDQNITWSPKMENNSSLLIYASWQVETVKNYFQELGKSRLATSSTTDPSLPGDYINFGNGSEERRIMAFLGRAHYSLFGRYILDASFRREGDSRFGRNNLWGNFYGASAKWIMSDEGFMKATKSWLTELGWRIAYGVTGNPPDRNYLYFSRYNGSGSYIDLSAIRPVSLQLANLKWETSSSYNGGFDLSLFDYKFNLDANIYKKRTKDLLLKGLSIPTASGFSSLDYVNAGIIDNNGWELNVNTQKLITFHDWSLDFNFNMANNANKFISLDPSFARSYNKDFVYANDAGYLSRIQENNALGSIYGFRYKGVYQYDKYKDSDGNPNPGTSPFARNADGNIILDGNGDPVPMTFAYGSSMAYTFRGGDAIYEDINHDGTINELDIVYLGNSNPKLNGGFGATVRYKNFSVNAFFNFRYGNKIINQARRDLESMYGNNNQSIAVNWRWLKDGDQTEIPRALYNFGYNSLPSDRFVEDGSYVRFKFLTFMFNFEKKHIKNLGLNQLDLYLTLNDLFTFTSYRGVDPEIMQNMNQQDGLVGISVDKNRTPRAQYFTLGITAGF
ncbi:MAG: SusC/RagA family TonB-linked outer membrane protein [Dysgonamonadaceae bacterium]|jgi:TonB-linked SusC/RagA family outer membrane protein|nr:SusC/RagA family TonB-linked outer membrane protein [Dysgonamonadaceae bacterium]